MGNNVEPETQERYDDEVKKKVNEICEIVKDVEQINKFLISNIDDTAYEDEEDIDSTAYGALVMKSANCSGFTLAMILILKKLNIEGEKIKFVDTELTGVAVGKKIYSPYIQKLCERSNINFNNWIASHNFEIE